MGGVVLERIKEGKSDHWIEARVHDTELDAIQLR